MTDPISILASNLTEALRHVNAYLALGLVSAVSAFVLDRQPADREETATVSVLGGFVQMPREPAKMVLLGICFVAGMMAYFAANAGASIALRLQTAPEILAAACTYPSVATAPLAVRIIAAVMPVAFVAPIVWRTWARLRSVAKEDGGGLIAVFGFFFVPYGALGMALWRLTCGR